MWSILLFENLVAFQSRHKTQLDLLLRLHLQL